MDIWSIQADRRSLPVGIESLSVDIQLVLAGTLSEPGDTGLLQVDKRSLQQDIAFPQADT